MDPPDPQPYEDRTDAGDHLAGDVPSDLDHPIVIALPRGGVPVAEAVATHLGAPMEVLVARKVGAPGRAELAIGAIAEGGVRVADERALGALGIDDEAFERMADAEEAELERRIAVYRRHRGPPPVQRRDVVLVDDGIATGLTAEAAVRSLRRLGAARVVLAVPVGAPDALRRLEASVDQVVCRRRPADLVAVGRWYRTFDQTSDDEVVEALDRSRSRVSEERDGRSSR